jgi:hypothetical protein
MFLAYSLPKGGRMPEAKLDELVAAYRSSGSGKELILDRVAALVYGGHRRYGFDDEDDAANAVLKFRGRIARLIDRYQDRGLPFDAYLAANLRFLARTARRDRRRIRERESVCERALMDEFAAGEAEGYACQSPDPRPEPSGDPEPGPGPEPQHAGPEHSARPPAKRRPRARGGRIPRCPAEAAAYSSRLVYLAIKCAWEIDEEGVARVAESAGVGERWLAAAVEQARRSLEAERSKVGRLAERRNASWTRIRLLEARTAEETDPYKRSKLDAALARERARFARAKADLGSLRTTVPNSVVARILGIPKGTVDSGLFYLRKRFGEPEG